MAELGGMCLGRRACCWISFAVLLGTVRAAEFELVECGLAQCVLLNSISWNTAWHSACCSTKLDVWHILSSVAWHKFGKASLTVRDRKTTHYGQGLMSRCVGILCHL